MIIAFKTRCAFATSLRRFSQSGLKLLFFILSCVDCASFMSDGDKPRSTNLKRVRPANHNALTKILHFFVRWTCVMVCVTGPLQNDRPKYLRWIGNVAFIVNVFKPLSGHHLNVAALIIISSQVCSCVFLGLTMWFSMSRTPFLLGISLLAR